MKKIVSAILASSAVLMSTSAMAQHSFPMVYQGVVGVQKGSGPYLTCNATVTFNDATTVNVSIAPGHPYCATVVFNNPNTYTYDHSSGALVIENLYADTTVTEGDCQGDLVATKSGGIIEASTSLPEVTGGGACTIDAELELVP